MAVNFPRKNIGPYNINCSDHELPGVVGCKLCLRFLCDCCISENNTCPGERQHDIGGINDVAYKIESRYDRAELDSISRKCQDLRENGLSALNELVNEKNRIDEMFEVQRKIIEDHLKQVQEKLRAANHLLSSEDMSSIPYYTTLVKATPSIQLKISGDNIYSVQVEGDEANENRYESDMNSKSLKYVTTFSLSNPYNFQHGPKIIVTTRAITTGSHTSTEFGTYNLQNGKLVQYKDPVIRKGNQALGSISKSGRMTVARKNHHFSPTLVISSDDLRDQEISEGWCKNDLLLCILGDEWILFFLSDGCIKFYSIYSNKNYADFNFRKEQMTKTQPIVVIQVNETQFCMTSHDKLYLYEFDPIKISVKEKWSVDLKSASNTCICYSKLYDLILVSKPGALLMVRRLTGTKLNSFKTPEFAETPPANMMMIDDQILFDMTDRILLYKLVHKEKEGEEKNRWKKLTGNLQKLKVWEKIDK